MKRFVIFMAVMPPLGFITAFWVMLQIANWMAGGPSTFDLHQVVLLPTAYLFGVIPAMLIAWFDHTLAKRETSHRVALTALFAYAFTYVPLLAVSQLKFMHEPSAVLFGLVGAVPAAVCSWLATVRRQPVGA